MLFLFLMCSISEKQTFLDAFDKQGVTYSVVLKGMNRYDFENIESVENGNTEIFECDIEKAKNLKFSDDDCLGETISFYGSFEEFESVVAGLDLENMKEESFDNMVCVYGYTNNFKGKRFVSLDGKKINVQIAINGQKIFIGTPVIVGSY